MSVHKWRNSRFIKVRIAPSLTSLVFLACGRRISMESSEEKNTAWLFFDVSLHTVRECSFEIKRRRRAEVCTSSMAFKGSDHHEALKVLRELSHLSLG